MVILFFVTLAFIASILHNLKLKSKIALFSSIPCLLLILLFLTGCQPTITSTPSLQTVVMDEASSPTPRISASATLPVDPAETVETKPTSNPDSFTRTKYTLSVELNYSNHILAVQQQILYVNQSSDSLNDLRLMIEPLHYPGVFKLLSITWQDDQPVQGYSYEGGQMYLPLQKPLGAGEKILINLMYELSLPSPTPSQEVRPVPFGYTTRQTNLVDWYPFIPPYLTGEGWLAHPPGYFGEHLVYDLADFDVQIRILDPRPDLTIAASTTAVRDGDWYHYKFEAARNFAWSVSSEYVILTTEVEGVSISTYTFPFHAEAGQRVLQTTAEALALFNELYGPYPRQVLSVVEADFLDGMEYDGMYFLSNGFYNLYQGSPSEYLVAIAAHETAHQWFYALIGNDQALEPWLDEATCTYNEKLFFERYYPEALDWWWAYRVNYYEPKGWVNGSIYNPEGYRSYRDAVYLNGALFFNDLRELIGDQKFFAFWKVYTNNYSQQIVTGDDFFETLSKYTQTDIQPLLESYFSTP